MVKHKNLNLVRLTFPNCRSDMFPLCSSLYLLKVVSTGRTTGEAAAGLWAPKGHLCEESKD